MKIIEIGLAIAALNEQIKFLFNTDNSAGQLLMQLLKRMI